MDKHREPKRRHEILRQLLGLFPTGSVVDLGTGHGQFAIAAADLGWNVTGVDARSTRWPDDDRITWIQQDVREHDISGYDVVLCLGLFYHLTLDDQLGFLRRANRKPLIIDTHVANDTVERRLSEPVSLPAGSEARGRAPAVYDGRMYAEGRTLTASFRNRESFWPTLDSFYRMLTNCGFSTILPAEPWVIPDRTFFLALPAEPSPRARPAIPGQRGEHDQPGAPTEYGQLTGA